MSKLALLAWQQREASLAASMAWQQAAPLLGLASLSCCSGPRLDCHLLKTGTANLSDSSPAKARV